MKKFICYAIFIFHFLFQLQLHAKEFGYLWTPIAWTLTLNPNIPDDFNLEIKSISLNFYDKSNDRVILKEMSFVGKKNAIVILNKKKRSQIFFAKKFNEFEEGKYEFKGLMLKYRINKGEISQFEVLATNLYKKDKDKYLQVQIQNNHISPMPEVSFETKFDIKNNQLADFTNYYDIIEDDYIEINEIYNEIKSLKNKLFSNKVKFMYANKIFPPLQLNGSKIRHPNSNNLGMLVDVSCDIKGILKTVWVNKTDLLQYVFYRKVNYDKSPCNIHNTFIQKFYLPNGVWNMQSMTIASKDLSEKKFQTYPLIIKAKELKKYFKMNDDYFKIQNIKERTLLKIIELNLTGNKDKNGIYFLGSSEIKKEDTENNDGGIVFYFKRNYEIVSLKKMFEVKKIFNAYSGELMKKDRIIGDIQLKIILTGTKKTNKRLESQLAELRDFVSTEVTVCVSDQEVIDPLLVLNGNVQLKNLKENSRLLNISMSDFNFVNSGVSQDKVKQCIMEKLKKFSFKKTFTTPFKAQIVFESY